MNQPQTAGLGYFTQLDFDKKQDIWEVCTMCNGTGLQYPITGTANNSEYCKVCDGKMIISKVNGRPPSE
uniref:Uncharacterized protein n=1 Tax=viral metagenome TaxID=1070528 RepID=A0A6M3XY33_9ZZZZ